MKKFLAIALVACLALGITACGGAKTSTSGATDETTKAAAVTTAAATKDAAANVAVFYYTYSDTYISSVRAALDKQLDSAGVKYHDYDSNSSQTTQAEQVDTALTQGATMLIVNIVESASKDAAQSIVDKAKQNDIPVLFFNREVDKEIVNSYEKCAFVGTDAAEAGHLQGTMIADFLLKNYDATDLNGDGIISYVMFKGQEGNPEADFRTQFSVEDANKALTAGGKKELSFYDAKNKDKYLVDKGSNWSAQASNEYMTTIFTAYSEANKNMPEIIICNNDGMAEGAITALKTAGYNDGKGKTIPVFGVDATDAAKDLISKGSMTGTIKQDADAMAACITKLTQNITSGAKLMDNTTDYKIDTDSAKVRIPYAIYTGK